METHEGIEGENEGDEEEMDPVVASENLLKAVKEDDEETAMEYLENKQINALYESSDKWSPLLWAWWNGNERIVRKLLRDHNAASPYLHTKEEQYEVEGNDDPFKKPKIASVVGRYTPLHWASYKGHFRIVWMLIKEGLSPLDIDIYGNTAVHQAAASGSLQVFECYLSQGVDVEMKNARGHTSYDLASNNIKEIIKKAIDTVMWVKWGSEFDFKNIRFYWISWKQFYWAAWSKWTWEFETPESENQEKPVCRCNDWETKKKKAEKNVRDAMETMHYDTVDKVLSELGAVKSDLDVKLMKEAEILHLKLQKEKEINELIDSLAYVPNYKTIKKSVFILEEKVTKAKELNVDVDPDIISKVNATTARLIAERNLQFQMEKVSISSSTHDDVKALEDIFIHKAKATGVAAEYTDRADVYLDKMKRNIRAREILDLLEQYPLREYPEPPEPEPKGKGKAPPPPPPKKKKKKEPPFPTPEWAKELGVVESEVKSLVSLLQDKEALELSEDFAKRSKDQFDRFKKEIAFRKDQEEQERLALEAKKNKKAGAKKK